MLPNYAFVLKDNCIVQKENDLLSERGDVERVVEIGRVKHELQYRGAGRSHEPGQATSKDELCSSDFDFQSPLLSGEIVPS